MTSKNVSRHCQGPTVGGGKILTRDRESDKFYIALSASKWKTAFVCILYVCICMCEIHTRHAALQVLCNQVVKALTLFSAQHTVTVNVQHWLFTGSTTRLCSGIFGTMAHGEIFQVRKIKFILYPFLLPNYAQFTILMKSNCKDKFISPTFLLERHYLFFFSFFID